MDLVVDDLADRLMDGLVNDFKSFVAHQKVQDASDVCHFGCNFFRYFGARLCILIFLHNFGFLLYYFYVLEIIQLIN